MARHHNQRDGEWRLAGMEDRAMTDTPTADAPALDH
jgi:hypothetical protein